MSANVTYPHNPLPPMVETSEVLDACCMSRRTLYRLMASGKFPKPKKPGGKLLWLASDVQAWQEADHHPAPAAPAVSAHT